MSATFDIPEECKADQRVIVREHLKREGSLDSITARDQYAIWHLPARIHELRKEGWQIVTQPQWKADAQGRLHKVAFYKLMAGFVPA